MSYPTNQGSQLPQQSCLGRAPRSRSPRLRLPSACPVLLPSFLAWPERQWLPQLLPSPPLLFHGHLAADSSTVLPRPASDISVTVTGFSAIASPVTSGLGGTSLVSLGPFTYNRENSRSKVPSAKIPVPHLVL